MVGLLAQLAACCLGPVQLGLMQLRLVARGTSPGAQLTSVGVVMPPPPPVGGLWRHSRFVPIARGDGEAVPVHLFNTLGGGAGGKLDGSGCHVLRGCDDAVCNFLVALGSEVNIVSVCVLFQC